MATDYEQKYKEALERAKKFEDKYGGDYAGYIFPELAESEDERIRKWLYDYFSTIKEMIWIHRDITCEQILDWLEKQKEQKPGEIPPYVTGIKGDPDPAGVWKPSEEQMNALYDILHPADTVNRLALESLYEQLKAL